MDAGANDDSNRGYLPHITSFDYGAPISESGRTTTKYEVRTGSPFFQWPQVCNRPYLHKQYIQLYREIIQNHISFRPIVSPFALHITKWISATHRAYSR